MAKSGAYRKRMAPDIANFGELLIDGITHGDMQWNCAGRIESLVPQSTH